MIVRILSCLFGLSLSLVAFVAWASAMPAKGSVSEARPVGTGLAPDPVARLEGRCELSEKEGRLLSQLLQADGQRRSRLRCEPMLQAFAESRARDMAERGYFGHMTPERRGPNFLLEEAGYPLPSSYGGALANSVEAIVAGYAEVERVWQELLASSAHRRHVLGEIDFFRSQDEIGIAHYSDPESEYRDYWVIVIARRARDGEPRYACTPSPPICFEVGTESGQAAKARP